MSRSKQPGPASTRRFFRAAACAVVLAGLPACATTRAANPATSEPVKLMNTDRFTMPDQATGREYAIFVHDSMPQSSEPKPVIYMTDANFHFATMVESLRYQMMGDPGKAGGAIIVGIGYPDGVDAFEHRNTDLTNSPEDVYVAPMFGGDKQFRRFLLEQVKPLIESTRAVDKDRETLFGHSFGGLFALETLLASPEAFDRYVAASPSLWWGHKALLRIELNDLAHALEAVPDHPKVLITVGELEQVDEPPAKAAPDDIKSSPPQLPGFADRRQIDDAIFLAHRLNTDFGVETSKFIIPGEGHMSVVPASIAKALDFALQSAPG